MQGTQGRFVMPYIEEKRKDAYLHEKIFRSEKYAAE